MARRLFIAVVRLEQMHRAQIERNLNGRRLLDVPKSGGPAKPYFVCQKLKRGFVYSLGQHPERQWEPHAQHLHQPDHFGRRVEAALRGWWFG